MLTAAKVRAMALSLPEAVELPHFDRASFRIGKKIFATLAEHLDLAVIVSVRPRERVYALLEEHPRMFVEMGGWTRMGALGVSLPHADPELFRELLVASWRKIAPKRALAALDGTTLARPKEPRRRRDR